MVMRERASSDFVIRKSWCVENYVTGCVIVNDSNNIRKLVRRHSIQSLSAAAGHFHRPDGVAQYGQCRWRC